MEANTPGTPSSPQGTSIQDRVNAPARPKGPNASAIVAGLVAIVLAGVIIVNETTAWNVDWSGLGPGAIVIVGVVLAVIGAIGLVRRHDDI
ncbi:MAG TPA: hypothetical protein VFF32_00375 [Dermatophilaceae bacterium]|nr:hypothetical protein [Dermatophilaceae bacterium]